MFLALQLHKMLDEVLAMPADHFRLWAAYFDAYPDGERDDARTALLCSVVANCHSTKRRFKLSDFMPKRKTTLKPSQQSLKDRLLRWVWTSRK